VDLTGGVVVRRWVRWREPLSNILFYLVPCDRVSVLKAREMEAADHKHVIFSMSSTTGHTTVQLNVGSWVDEIRTPHSTPHSLSDGHPDLLLYQAI
jgi:hypothetical protein